MEISTPEVYYRELLGSRAVEGRGRNEDSVEEETELQCNHGEGLIQPRGPLEPRWSFTDVPCWAEDPDLDQPLSVDPNRLDPLPSWKFPERADP